jgi:hypothetical protein
MAESALICEVINVAAAQQHTDHDAIELAEQDAARRAQPAAQTEPGHARPFRPGRLEPPRMLVPHPPHCDDKGQQGEQGEDRVQVQERPRPEPEERRERQPDGCRQDEHHPDRHGSAVAGGRLKKRRRDVRQDPARDEQSRAARQDDVSGPRPDEGLHHRHERRDQHERGRGQPHHQRDQQGRHADVRDPRGDSRPGIGTERA